MRKVRVAMWALGIFAAVMISTIFFGDWEKWPGAFKQDIFWEQASGPFWGWTILFFMWLSWAQVQAMKTQTNLILGQNRRFFFNKNDEPIDMGFWEGQRVGGINALKSFLNLPGNEGTVIYPKDAKQPFGDTRLILGLWKRRPFAELSEAVKVEAKRHGLPGPYYVAYAPHFVETRGKDWTASVREWEKENAARHVRAVSDFNTIQGLDHNVRVLRSVVETFGQPKAVGWLKRTFNEMRSDRSERASNETYNQQG